MKAVLALIIIYIGTFLIAIQGASTNPAQAAQSAPQELLQPAKEKPVDPVKESDIRSLLELVGARDMIQDAADNSISQFKEKVSSTISSNGRAQNVANTFAANFQRKYDPDALMEQLVVIYDKHYTHEEIRGLLQFYGSPLGQKAAAEMPKIAREVQAATRAISNQAARDAWQELKAENPGAAKGARPFASRRGQLNQSQQPVKATQQVQADSQQP